MVDRPLECSQCKKSIAVHYTEIVDGKKVATSMCRDCPVLQRMLHGHSTDQPTVQPDICCGTCQTTLEQVRTGNPLGCSDCFDIFQDVIQFDLSQAKRISSHLEGTPQRKVALHIGRAPGEAHGLSPEIKLIALKEALTDTLTKEDYEQAAWLRDQIRAIKEKIDES